jgi:uncharacterized protein (TIGR02301 family)
MRITLRPVLVFGFLVCGFVMQGAISLSAQQQRRTTPLTSPPPASSAPVTIVPEAPPPTYEPEMLRLAEVLGGLSYLATLCSQSGSENWQLRMTQLIEAEGTTTQRKERLAGAYNRGYLGYQPAHRTCSDTSRLSIDTLVEKGQKITAELARRYGE